MIDGTGKDPVDFPVIVVKNNVISGVGVEDQIDLPKGREVREITLENGTLLPGLIDSHVHLALGTHGRYEEMMRETDGVHLITGIVNSGEALHAGITTIKEAGARNRVALDLREGWRKGLIEAPRLIVSGRPLTVPGGHFHFCNNNECEGVDEVRERVRQLVEEGVDFIKIMASGGGTRGTSNRQASFSEEELRAAVEEAHRLNKTVAAHCEAYESVGNAARAGVDVLEHCGFILPNGSRGFDKEAVRTMVDEELYYDPTLQTGAAIRDALREREQRGETLTESEKSTLARQEYKIRRKSENLARMLEMGVQVVAGSDGIGLGNSARLIRAMELMAEAGMTPMQVITAATSKAAKALKVDNAFGAIKEGLEADIIVVEGDPSSDISSLRSLKLLMQRGKIVDLGQS
ncbi:MAG: amidohydrolase family protein [Candidatus Bathyarchaeota archaeon]|nr:amidohydrolase family protein [Candidatus Bathyarchaeota archaeon]